MFSSDVFSIPSPINPNVLLTLLTITPTLGYLCRKYLLLHFPRVFCGPRITLSDMPFDVIYALSLNLSVRDLCALRQTSRSLSGLVNDHSLWRTVLKDILEVRPIPRLKYALENMSLDECMRTSIRLADLDRKIRGTIPNAALSVVKEHETNRAEPTLLPGGRYYVTLDNSRHSLTVHEFYADSLSFGRALVPPSKYPIQYWDFVVVSPDELIIATASIKQKQYAQLGKWKHTTHVYIYRSKPSTATFTKLDHFTLDFSMCHFSITDRYIALEGGYPYSTYVRYYSLNLDTPVLVPNKSKPQSFPGGTLVVDDFGHLVINHCGGLRVFKLPPLKPITSTRVPSRRVPISSVWEADHDPDRFDFPFVTTPLPDGNQFVWGGHDAYMATFNYSQQGFGGCKIKRYPGIWSRMPLLPLIEEHTLGSFGCFSGLYAEIRGHISAFSFSWLYGPQRGSSRLEDVSAEPTHIPLSTYAYPNIEPDEFPSRLSFDEESGRLIIELCGTKESAWRIELVQM